MKPLQRKGSGVKLGKKWLLSLLGSMVPWFLAKAALLSGVRGSRSKESRGRGGFPLLFSFYIGGHGWGGPLRELSHQGGLLAWPGTVADPRAEPRSSVKRARMPGKLLQEAPNVRRKWLLPVPDGNFPQLTGWETLSKHLTPARMLQGTL